MVDISGKTITARSACAEGFIDMAASTLKIIREGGAHKGDVLGVARIAAIQAAKRTDMLIPLCHQIPLSGITVTWDFPGISRIRCCVTARTQAATGVEMEALVAVGVALLTVYDMCKAIDRGMIINGIGLLSKEGGRSGIWNRET